MNYCLNVCVRVHVCVCMCGASSVLRMVEALKVLFSTHFGPQTCLGPPPQASRTAAPRTQGRPLQAIAAAKRHCLALTAAGEVLTWGHTHVTPRRVALAGAREGAREAGGQQRQVRCCVCMHVCACVQHVLEQAWPMRAHACTLVLHRTGTNVTL